MFDQSNVKYIKRIVVGSDNPARICTREETEAQMAELNDCLTGAVHPRGTLLAVERSFTLVRIGEHQVVLEWLAYHVGFPANRHRRPPGRRRPSPAAHAAPAQTSHEAGAGAGAGAGADNVDAASGVRTEPDAEVIDAAPHPNVSPVPHSAA
ncbi:hypothetical protein ACQ859_13720 [Roseateles chitinivorans]|uniref:hypothetical protein n=1 Tax=Roseateles chitinivorans TaxID=2917965 RepID=UPI003D677FB2